MILQLGDYTIEGSKLIGRYSKFDVFYHKEIKSGKMEGEKVKEVLWYDTTFEKCLQSIAQDRMNKENGEALDVDSWFKKYKEINEKLVTEINAVNETLKQMIKTNELL